MKTLTLLLLVLLFSIGVKSQNANLVFFSENGEHFSVVMNGMLQNLQPETNIKVVDLPAPSYKVKIIFEDKILGEINKTIYVNPGSETTYAIKNLKKKGYALRLMNTYAILPEPRIVDGQMVTGYNPQGVSASAGSSTSIVNTTTINNNITISANGVGNNVNVVNTNDNIGNQTATSGTGMGVGNLPAGVSPGMPPTGYVMPGYDGLYGCAYPMSPGDFEAAKASIKSKSFEDSKLTIAKQIIQTNCLLSAQVREIMLLFNFEDTRLDLAKFAYSYTLDLGNYYKLNDAFTFESSIDELNRYIQSAGGGGSMRPGNGPGAGSTGYVLPGYNGPYGCPYPMSNSEFESAKYSIKSKSFEDSKLTIAKQIIANNCLLSSQVKEIMLLFAYEDTRLDFAKYAYAFTLDLRNYYKLNDAFTFESSIDELNRFIQGTGR